MGFGQSQKPATLFVLWSSFHPTQHPTLASVFLPWKAMFLRAADDHLCVGAVPRVSHCSCAECKAGPWLPWNRRASP